MTPDLFTEVRTGQSIVPGRYLRDEGIKQTLDAEKTEWKERAAKWLRIYAMRRGSFTAEEFRARWAEVGFDPPHSHHVWGALFLTAARQKWLLNTGIYVKATSAKTHSHPVPVWKYKR